MRFFSLALIACVLGESCSRSVQASAQKQVVYLPVVSLGQSVIGWDEATELVMACRAQYVIVWHWYRVEIILSDSSRITTYEPYLNAMFDLVNASGCNTPIMAE